MSKARDYARALHGSLVRIEQLADSGLLVGSSSGERVLHAARARSLAGGGPDGVDAPSLDVVPQVISATVDARFVAEVPELS